MRRTRLGCTVLKKIHVPRLLSLVVCSPTPSLAQRWEARKHRRVTDFFILANVLIFALDFLMGSKLTILGVKHNPSIVAGEWWRLFTCNFLHGGLLHVGA